MPETPPPLDPDATTALAAECDLADRNMRKWVRYPVKHLRSLLAEVESLRAEVASLRQGTQVLRGWITEHEETIVEVSDALDEARLAARPAPAWDEEAAIGTFKAAWHKADAEGRAGERVRDGLAAVVREHMTARPAPAWDEEAVRGALVDAQLASARQMMHDGHPSIFIRSNEDAADKALAVVREHMTTNTLPAPAWDEEAMVLAVSKALREHGGWFADLPADEMNCCARAVLAVVREHLPVKPDREAMATAVGYHLRTGIAEHRALRDTPDKRRQSTDARIVAATDEIYLLWSGRSEAEGGADRG